MRACRLAPARPAHGVLARALLFSAVSAAFASIGGLVAADDEDCARCGWKTPRGRRSAVVRTSGELLAAVGAARAGATILIEDGEYVLPRMVHITAPGVVLRGKSGDRKKVVLRGAGMDERAAGVGISIAASKVVVADLSVGQVGFHGIQVRGELGVEGVAVHGVRVFDCGQQLLKGSVGKNGKYADDGLVACSTFEYRERAPSDYTNGVDVLAGKGWTVRDCVFRNIRGPEARGGAAGPAILFWANSIDTVIERNLVVDCYRGIALGLKPGLSELARDGEKRFDHQRGVVRQNIVVSLDGATDEGIEINGCPDVVVEHNTVFVEGKLPWSIGLRFAPTSGVVRNNLSNRQILLRDGGTARLAANVRGAERTWFVDCAQADLRLRSADLPAVDAAQPIEGLRQDFARRPRATGRAPDAGAHEYRPAR